MGKRRKIRSVSVLPTCLSLGNVLHAFSVVKGLSRQDDQIQVANQSMTLQMFHPFDQLALKLLAASADDGGDLEVLAAAVLLHDCIQVAKDSPLRSKASLLAANESRHAHRGAGVEG
jgi:hypothetical protein